MTPKLTEVTDPAEVFRLYMQAAKDTNGCLIVCTFSSQADRDTVFSIMKKNVSENPHGAPDIGSVIEVDLPNIAACVKPETIELYGHEMRAAFFALLAVLTIERAPIQKFETVGLLVDDHAAMEAHLRSFNVIEFMPRQRMDPSKN